MKYGAFSLRQFYTEDAGYALATKIDTDLHSCGTGFGDGGTVVFSGSVAPTDYQHTGCFFNDGGTTTQYTDDTIVPADVFSDAFFRDMIQKLDDNNVPMKIVYLLSHLLFVTLSWVSTDTCLLTS